VGRLTPRARSARADVRSFARSALLRRPAAHCVDLRAASMAARDAGRSCYFRPLFDRPRCWATQRTPRSMALAAK